MRLQSQKARRLEHHGVVIALSLILLSLQFGCGTVATTSAAEEIPAGVPADGAAAAPAEMEAAAGEGEIRERGWTRSTLQETRCRAVYGQDATYTDGFFPVHTDTCNSSPGDNVMGTPIGGVFPYIFISNFHMRFERAVIQNGKFICQYRMGPRNGSTTRTSMIAGGWYAYECTPGSGFSVQPNGATTCTSSNPAACRAICRR